MFATKAPLSLLMNRESLSVFTPELKTRNNSFTPKPFLYSACAEKSFGTKKKCGGRVFNLRNF
ncbi:MAG: hypothetical protein OXU31_09665, partial [Gammaproteobacteria bacterium]|nr:hypothetical protein [Gammaproteobacteria bacterium]